MTKRGGRDWKMIKLKRCVEGASFGGVTAIGPAFGRVNPRVVCQCHCGNVFATHLACLSRGKTKSCGCMGSPGNYRHGMAKTSEYQIWSGMIKRCTSKNCRAYKNYGGRGISVCPEWSGPGGFDRFIEFVGRRPSKEHSIDRIDNDKGYFPGNVRWATRFDQARNKRPERKGAIVHNGVAYSIIGFARFLGIPRSVVADRVRLGWSSDRIASTPYTPRSCTRECQKQ